jgi:hypothetical protein
LNNLISKLGNICGTALSIGIFKHSIIWASHNSNNMLSKQTVIALMCLGVNLTQAVQLRYAYAADGAGMAGYGSAAGCGGATTTMTLPAS